MLGVLQMALDKLRFL